MAENRIVVRKPESGELEKLGIDSWPTWECGVSTFDWTYGDRETAYVFEGRVQVKTDRGTVEVSGGDLVVFEAGLSCTWKVIEPIRKVYRFE